MKLILSLILAFSWIYGGGQYSGTTYYLSPTGNDSNNGLSAGAPWLTPNHSVRCGDTINAAAGTYSSANFSIGKWGAVTSCPTALGRYTANLLCAGPDVTSCIINDTTQTGGAAMEVGASNWSVSGWTTSSTVASCFSARPNTSADIQYIAFINVIAAGCQGSGISTAPANSHGVDEVAMVGAIAYNAAQGSSFCFSGFSDYEPRNVDGNSGTHKFYAGLFGFANIDANPCGGGAPTDGEGFIFDNWSNSQTIGVAYTGQAVMEQSLFAGNGHPCVEVGQSTAAPITITGVTCWGDMQDSNISPGGNNGEMFLNGSFGITITKSIFQATLATQNTVNVYAFNGYQTDTTSTLTNSYIFGVTGNNWHVDNSGGFALGSGVTQATPNYVAPATPTITTSTCNGFATTTACMATVIANFVAQAAGAAGLGYQSPAACAPDALFPIWLKGIVPNGIITKPCGM